MVDLKLDIAPEFFKEEVKCGYMIPAKMKEVWAVELDLLNELIHVCDKYGIRVIADSGTLLGCVRHEGFIPWDDDIDVYLFRDDYQKLCEVASKEFTGNYFFQNALTDDLMRSHGQLRRSDTTAFLKSDYRLPHNRGIFIDIFILDFIPDEEEEIVKFRDEVHEKYALMEEPRKKVKKDTDSSLKKFLKPFWNILCYPSKARSYKKRIPDAETRRKYFSDWQTLVSKYDNKTNSIGNLTYRASINKKVLKLSYSDYQDLIPYKFEMLTLWGPRNYDNRLRLEYGDYMKFVIGTQDHGGCYFDTGRSYKEFDSLSYEDFLKLFK